MPFLSKATGYQLADIATNVILGTSLKEQGIFDLYPPEKERCYVKRRCSPLPSSTGWTPTSPRR